MRTLGRRDAPTAAQTERFTRAVMERLEPAAYPWAGALTRLLEARWLVPALSVGLACVFVSIGREPADAVASLDLQVLMGPATPDVADLVLPPDPSRVEAPLLSPEAP